MQKHKLLNSLLSPEEQELLNHLGLAWNMYVKLPPRHQAERYEFMTLIHRLQNMVFSRPFLKEIYDYKELSDGEEILL